MIRKGQCIISAWETTTSTLLPAAAKAKMCKNDGLLNISWSLFESTRKIKSRKHLSRVTGLSFVSSTGPLKYHQCVGHLADLAPLCITPLCYVVGMGFWLRLPATLKTTDLQFLAKLETWESPQPFQSGWPQTTSQDQKPWNALRFRLVQS